MSKYNNKKVEYDGHKFDSMLERDFYIHLQGLIKQGIVSEVLMQKSYILLDGYDKNGKKIRPIIYKADFEVHYQDNSIEVIDVKGFETHDFRIKKKLFEYRYPFELKLITYTKLDGWITLDELKKARKKRKQLKLSKK